MMTGDEAKFAAILWKQGHFCSKFNCGVWIRLYYWVKYHSSIYRCLGTFAKLRKATINLVVSVLPERLGSHWTDFHEIWYLSIFRKKKPVEKLQVSLKPDEYRVLYRRTTRHFWSSLSQFFLEWDVSDKSCRENQNTHFVFDFPPQIMPFMWDNVEKYCRAGQATWQYDACALHAGYLRLQTLTRNM
jgi:hypothetical protein